MKKGGRVTLRESIRKEERKEKGRDKTKKRVKELDSFKGFLIFLVVLGHFLLPLSDSPYPLFNRSFYLIYSFHMPAFLFLSGYFAYGKWKKRGTSFRSLFSYLLLYILMKFMLHRADILFYDVHTTWPDFFHESSTPWYLLVLFFLELTLLPMEIFRRKKTGEQVISFYFLCLILLSIPLSFMKIGEEWKDFLASDRILGFAPFFYLGMLAKLGDFSFQKIHRTPFVLGFCFTLIIILFLPKLLPYTRVFYGTWGYRIEGEAILPFFKKHPTLIRIAFIPFSLCIAYFFYGLLIFLRQKKESIQPEITSSGSQIYFGMERVFQDRETFLMKMGHYSMPIYVFHRPFRDAFFAGGLEQPFWHEGIPFWLILLFYIFLLLLSLLLLFVLGRKTLDNLCRFRFTG